jgi:four helix bundle protein
MRRVEDLDVFRLSHSLALEVYRITTSFPSDERFGLVVQMRKAASSIPTNIKEGGHRLSSKEYRQFVGIARGSTGEIKYQLLLAKDLGYISGEECSRLTSESEHQSNVDEVGQLSPKSPGK